MAGDMQLVPCPPPWKPGEVLDILTNMWRSDFQALAGPQMGQQKACEEDLRGLKRQYHSRSKGRRKWADIAERLLQLLHLFISNLPADDGDLGNSGVPCTMCWSSCRPASCTPACPLPGCDA